jgi:hypothetical protein
MLVIYFFGKRELNCVALMEFEAGGYYLGWM